MVRVSNPYPYPYPGCTPALTCVVFSTCDNLYWILWYYSKLCYYVMCYIQLTGVWGAGEVCQSSNMAWKIDYIIYSNSCIWLISRLKYLCFCTPTTMVRVQVLLVSQILTPTHTLPVHQLLPTQVSIPLTISRQERRKIYCNCGFTSLSHTQQGKGGY